MKQLLLAIAAITMTASTADASFLIDNFETPVVGAQQSDGSVLGINAPPNFFANRQLLSFSIGALSVNNDIIQGTMLGGETAFIEWTTPVIPNDGPDTFSDLEFENFVPTFALGATYDVAVNGTSISGGPQAFTSGLLQTSQHTFVPGDVLRITFATAPTGVLVFTAGSLQANPEPMSACLFGLALFGGVCRHRRRRD